MSATATRLDPAEIPVVILAGGFGTRLKEETERVPKPMVLIGDRPILWHIMKLYSSHGFRRFIVCLGYKSWLIKEFFLTYRERLSDVTVSLRDPSDIDFHNGIDVEDWEVTLAETGLNTATGGRLGRVAKYLGDAETFCFTYGDGLGNVDLTALLRHHQRNGSLGTVTGVHPTSRYGEMRLEGSRVAEFNEKPTRPDGFVSGGFFVFQRDFLSYVSEDEGLFFEYEPLQKLARDAQLTVFPHDDFWVGMDTYRDLTLLNELWASGAAPWKVWDS